MPHVKPALAALRAGAIMALLLCATARAQDVERSFVTTTGKATVYTAPTHVVFWIHHTITQETLTLALEQSARVDAAVREVITLKELHPALLETSTPAIFSAQDNTVRISTEVRFSMSAYAMGENAMVKFGELCEDMKEISAGLGSELTGPHFITTEKAAVTQDAVQEAAKEAYPAAVGAAAALNVAVRSVDLVDVGAITWNTPPDTEAAFPTVAQMACTAEVRVTYVLE